MRQVKVWDPFVRLFHWGLALLVLGSFVTSDVDALVPVHVRLGLGVVGLVAARVVWGFLGPRFARFRTFVRGPREVLGYARELARGRPSLHLSHNPLGGLMVVALVAVLLALAATGAVVFAGPEFEGPLTGILSKQTVKDVKEVHEALSGLLLGLVGVHVLGVLASSLAERQNLVLGMITGWKRAPHGGRTLVPAVPGRLVRLAGATTAVALGVAAALGLALLIGLPRRAHAAGPLPTQLLREYEAAARAQNPAFRGFSAAEGRRFYLAEHTQEGERISCASCHTADPRQRGRTPVGKVVEPLAPAANPDRFTDRRDVEKWFKRNCKQVMGRECTAEEKGHFLAYVLAP
jgi:cytochrome b